MTETTIPTSLGPFGENEYFAFVESSEPLDEASAKDGFEYPTHWAPVLESRKKMRLKLPRAVMWLDCVRADYFSKLEWRNDECEINNSEHADQRRQHLLELDHNQFMVAVLPIDPRGKIEGDQFGLFGEMSWHLVKFGPHAGLPVLTGLDYDLAIEQPTRRFVRHRRFLHEDEFDSLRNVFSLNFLPDANLNGRERPDNSTPPRNSPPERSRDKALFVEILRGSNTEKEPRYHRQAGN